MKKLTVLWIVFAVTLVGCAATLLSGISMTSRVSASTAAVARVFDSKTLPKEMALGKNSVSEYGEVPFNHETHSFNKYSPDGKTDISCAECHHTDQPKTALKPPLVTSERNVLLTVEALKAADAAAVKGCQTCHFQEGNVPDGKEQAVDPKGKELNNELAYHINCNTCHDSAAKLRPELKKKPGFATTNDCAICHKKS